MSHNSSVSPQWVDMHVHLYPEPMARAVWKWFQGQGWGCHAQYVQDVRQTLAAHGVGRAVALSYPHKTGVAAELNRFMAGLGRADPMWLPFASVYPDDPDFKEYVDKALASPHLYGFKFQPLVQRFDVNDFRLDYLYRACIESRTPITMHIGSGPIANEFVGIGHFRKLMRRHPELRVCVPHMGWTEFDEFLRLMDDHPNMFLDTAVINVEAGPDMDTGYPVEPERLTKYADRVCFGSDWPLVSWDYQTALDSVRRFGFDADAIEAVMGRNALRFLGVVPG